MYYFLLGITLIFLGGLFSLLAADKDKGKIVCLFTGAGTLLILRDALAVLVHGISLEHILYLKAPFLEVKLLLDPLSAFFVVIISIMGFLGTFYSLAYLEPYIKEGPKAGYLLGSHYLFLSLLIVSMLLVAVVQNALAFLIVWELMSLSSFLLILFENKKNEVLEAAMNYLVAMQIGAMFLIAGFIAVALKSHSWDFDSFHSSFQTDPSWANGIFLVFFAGFGIKAGFVPLHTWLPKAHPAAPTHISAMMSGVMIKTGIYGILRIITFLPEPSPIICYLILFISLISGILGVIYAIAEHDLKKLLAYHSVENIGIIGLGIGLGLLGMAHHNPLLAIFGFAGGMLHVWNHALFKGLLFFGAGAIYQKTNTKNIELLGGLAKSMPYTAFFFLIGSLAICGLPLFNGFVSEFLIYTGMLSGFNIQHPLMTMVCVLSAATLALISALALLCFTKVFSVVFLGNPRSEHCPRQPMEVSAAMLIPMGILAFLCLLSGIYPQYIFPLLRYPLLGLGMGTNTLVTIEVFGKILSYISSVFLFFIALTTTIYIIRSIFLRKKIIRYVRTWDCGYPAATSRMQYSAASYAAPFLSLVKFLIHQQTHKENPKGLFPQRAQYASENKDIIESYIIGPGWTAIQKFLELFSGIQSGSIQQYILYGLIFLIGVLFWMVRIP